MFYDLDGLSQKILEGNKHNKYRLCSCHFTPDSYLTHDSIRSLRADAVPSIFPIPIEGECVISESLKKKRASRQKRLLQCAAQSTAVNFTPGEQEMVVDLEFKRDGFCNMGTQTDYTMSNSIVVVSQIQVPESSVIYSPIAAGRYFKSQFMSSPVESQLRIKKSSSTDCDSPIKYEII
ncbi:hypothetical protein GDO78_002750 [Eleutherodactylus coqui]|uniref:THAP-type domain-containing protein n=1 Tax=Eleutherodactylus coqui TaxID=57060 RepID=A0A8J6K341_ELECQ|nr:hypothetical protein GDO78_002750 [Eleutherodactylus coqui]